MVRDTLTRDEIIQAAIDLLDAEGLDGLNMRALGDRLGSAATAVYWHVGSKENLIALAGDRVWHEIALPDLVTTGWRAAAAAMAADLHAMLQRHVWLVQAFGSYVVYGPGKARHDDHGIAIYEAAGFTGAEVDQASATVFTFVLGNALGAAASASFHRKLAQQGGNPNDMLRASMEKAKAVAAQFPRLRTRLAAPATDYAAAPENTFAFGLDAILDGLTAQLAARNQRPNLARPKLTRAHTTDSPRPPRSTGTPAARLRPRSSRGAGGRKP